MSITNEVLAEGERLLAAAKKAEGARFDCVNRWTALYNWFSVHDADVISAARESFALRDEMEKAVRSVDGLRGKLADADSEVRALRDEVDALRAELAEARNGG